MDKQNCNLVQKAQQRKPLAQLTVGEELDVQQIFPAEVWSIIFKLMEPKNLLTLLHSSPRFESVLPAKIDFLFAPVLNCLFQNLDDISMCEIATTCRKVCKSWCIDVNNFLRSQLYWQLVKKEKTPLPACFAQFRVHAVHSQYKWTKLETYYDLTHLDENRNPFVTRHFDITFRSPKSQQTGFFQMLERFLAKYGHDVWYCHIQILVLDSDNFINECRRLLELMANLKVLSIFAMSMKTAERSIQAETIAPFPKLSSLQFLKVEGQGTDLLLDALLKTNQDEKLSVESNCYSKAYISSLI